MPTPKAATSSRCSRRCSKPSPPRSSIPTRRCRRTSPTSMRPRTSAGSRCAVCSRAPIVKGQTVAWCKVDGTIERVKLGELFVTVGLDRVPAEEAGPGELIAIAGIDTVTIGETIADADDPRPLPLISVDEPSLAMTIGINTSPLSGQSGVEAHRAAGEEPARPGARRQRVAARPDDRAPRRVGGAGARRAPARGARGDHAPRGLRARRSASRRS